MQVRRSGPDVWQSGLIYAFCVWARLARRTSGARSGHFASGTHGASARRTSGTSEQIVAAPGLRAAAAAAAAADDDDDAPPRDATGEAVRHAVAAARKVGDDWAPPCDDGWDAGRAAAQWAAKLREQGLHIPLHYAFCYVFH